MRACSVAFGCDGFAADEIEECRAADGGKVRRHLTPADAEFLQCRQGAERHDGERHSGRDGLDRDVLVEFRSCDAQHFRNVRVGVGSSELRFGLSHLAEEQPVALLKAHRNLADLQIENNFVVARMLAQIPGGAQSGMAGEGQLLEDGEDADLVTLVCSCLRRRAG